MTKLEISPFTIVIHMAYSSLRVVSIVRCYYVYKGDWNPDTSDLLGVEVEETNIHDRFAFAMTVNGQTVQYKSAFYLATRYMEQFNSMMPLGCCCRIWRL